MIERQSGRTTKQIREAPSNAVFVWPNSHVHYPKALAQELGRTDVTIVSPSWLDWSNRRTNRTVILDHAIPDYFPLTESQFAFYREMVIRNQQWKERNERRD